jgi:hypothetical protein
VAQFVWNCVDDKAVKEKIDKPIYVANVSGEYILF